MILKRLIIIAFSLSAWCAQASEGNIVIGLTDDIVEVDTGFAGATVTLFGSATATERQSAPLDIIAIITGPPGDFYLNELTQKGMIWTPERRHLYEGSPRFYQSLATRSINEIAPLPDQAQYGLGVERALSLTHQQTEDAQIGDYNAAFIARQSNRALFSDIVGDISFLEPPLFKITITLPADTPVGEYEVEAFLYQTGNLLGRDQTILKVGKVGLERQIYDFAHERPALYGLMCVALSLLAGWIAAVAFHKS